MSIVEFQLRHDSQNKLVTVVVHAIKGLLGSVRTIIAEISRTKPSNILNTVWQSCCSSVFELSDIGRHNLDDCLK
jgi:hypothetical protein